MIPLVRTMKAMNNRVESSVLGPEVAQSVSNVVLDSTGMRAQKGIGDAIATASGTIQSLYEFGGTLIASTTAWRYAEWGGTVVRVASGHTPQKSRDGIAWVNLGIAAPATPCTAAAGAAGTLTGTYRYWVTFTDAYGGESAPIMSAEVTLAAQKGSLTAVPTSTDTQVYGRNIYRSGGSQGATGLVGTIADNTTTTFTDDTAETAIGTTLQTAIQSPSGSPGQFEWIVITPEGVAVAGIGSTIYFSEVGMLSAWPALYTLTLPEAAKGAVAHPGQVVLFTTAAPYILSGTNPDNFTLLRLMSQQGCLVGTSLADMGTDGIFYQSPDGIVRCDGASTDVIAKQHLSDAFLAGLATSGTVGVRYNERFIAFFPACTSFPSGGYLEWNPRLGQYPWVMGTITAGAAHYSRTNDELYIAQGSSVYIFESGAGLPCSWRSGDYVGKTAARKKHLTRLSVEHTGWVSIHPYLDDVAFGTAQEAINPTHAETVFRFAQGAFGNRLSFLVTGDAGTLVDTMNLEADELSDYLT